MRAIKEALESIHSELGLWYSVSSMQHWNKQESVTMYRHATFPSTIRHVGYSSPRAETRPVADDYIAAFLDIDHLSVML